MADEPISSFPTASSATGPDLVPIVQGGTTKQSTVSQVIGALSGVPVITSMVLTDTVAVVKSATAKQITLQQVFDTGRLLVSSSTTSLDAMLGFQSGVAKTITASNASAPDTIASRNSANVLASGDLLANGVGGGAGDITGFGRLAVTGVSNLGGLITTLKGLYVTPAQNGLWLNSSGSNPGRFTVLMPVILSIPISAVAAPTYRFAFPMTGVGFTRKADWGFMLAENNNYLGTYVKSDAANDSGHFVFEFRKIDGTNIGTVTLAAFALLAQLEV